MEKLPEAFVERMKIQLGTEADDFFNALYQPAPTSIRLHHAKGKSNFENPEPIAWCDEGYYLPGRPAFFMDPHWHGGAYYVQEASSMILDYVLKNLSLDEKPRIWLDVCAAPGGKTGILAKHKRDADILIANEVVPQRNAILRENLIKGGYLNTFISSEQASSFKDPFADIILIDAPCAGEGMMRKDAEAIRQWSPNLVRECAIMQQRIVNDAVRSLNPEGYLIYSTCSYSREENIQNVERFIQDHQLSSVEIPFPASWRIVEFKSPIATGYQLYPHRIKGEGLFISVLKKSDKTEDTYSGFKPKKSSFNEPPVWLREKLGRTSYLIQNNDDHFAFILKNAEQKANEAIHQLPRARLITQAGELKGKDFIPDHFLAMVAGEKTSDQKIQLSLHQSLDYLERSTQFVSTDYAPGWYVAEYEGTNLGWAKKTPQGWKNHYPLNWRLRSRK